MNETFSATLALIGENNSEFDSAKIQNNIKSEVEKKTQEVYKVMLEKTEDLDPLLAALILGDDDLYSNN